MARKPDIQRVKKVAIKFGMSEDDYRLFGDYLEDCKRAGDVGSANQRGDFTWDELEDRAREFLEIEEENG